MDNIPTSVSTKYITCCKFIPYLAMHCFLHRQTWESKASTLELLIWFLQSSCRGISAARLCWLTWKDLERWIDYQVKVVGFFTSLFITFYTVSSCLANSARWCLSANASRNGFYLIKTFPLFFISGLETFSRYRQALSQYFTCDFTRIMALTKNTNEIKILKDHCRWCMKKAVFEKDLNWYNYRWFPRSGMRCIIRTIRHSCRQKKKWSAGHCLIMVSVARSEFAWWYSFLVFPSFGNLTMEEHTDVHCKIHRSIFANLNLVWKLFKLLQRRKMPLEMELI